MGRRPIDIHLDGFRKLGINVDEAHGNVYCNAVKLVGDKIALNFPSVGATENIIISSVMAKGRTEIINAAREPEIVDLANFLISAGASIYGAGSDTITIDGVKELKGCEYSVMPDRIEAGTFLIAGAISGGELLVCDIIPQHLIAITELLRETGCEIKEECDNIYLKAPKRLKRIENILTHPYPGFPTDIQPQMMSLLTMANGTSIIIETVFESRFKFVSELTRMGAKISTVGQTAIIQGVEYLQGTKVCSMDLRGGAALVLAGLAAEGKTIVTNSEYLERGYEHIEKKLTGLGANIALKITKV